MLEKKLDVNQTYSMPVPIAGTGPLLLYRFQFPSGSSLGAKFRLRNFLIVHYESDRVPLKESSPTYIPENYKKNRGQPLEFDRYRYLYRYRYQVPIPGIGMKKIGMNPVSVIGSVWGIFGISVSVGAYRYR